MTFFGLILPAFCGMEVLSAAAPAPCGQNAIYPDFLEAPLHREGRNFFRSSLLQVQGADGQPKPADVMLRLLVDKQGNVQAAKGLRGAAAFYREAENLERQIHFSPFVRIARPVCAQFEDAVMFIRRSNGMNIISNCRLFKTGSS